MRMRNDFDYIFTLVTKANKYTLPLIQLSGIFTAFGSILLILYFQQIRYLPPMTLADLTFLFVAAAMLGIQMLVLLGALSLSTGYFWHLAFSLPEIKEKLVVKDWTAQFRILVEWFILPVVILVLSLLLAAFDEYRYISIAVGLFTIVVIFCCTYFLQGIKASSSFGFLFLLVASAGALAVALVPWLGLAESSFQNISKFGAILVVFVLVIVLLLGSAVAIKPHDNFMSELPEGIRVVGWSSLIAIFTVVFLFVSFGGTNFTSLIAKNYGFGGILKAEVVLNSEGKETVKLLGLQCKQESKSKLCLLDNVGVLWARGDEYVFQFNKSIASADKDEVNDNQDFSKIWFVLPKKQVLSIKLPLSNRRGV